MSRSSGLVQYSTCAASKVVANFGIATECGLGRCKTPDDVRRLLNLHADVAKRLNG